MIDYFGYFLFVVFFGVLDTTLTINGIKKGANELNPIINSIIKYNGFTGLIMYKLFLLLIALVIIQDFKIVVVLSGIVVMSNIYQLYIKKVY